MARILYITGDSITVYRTYGNGAIPIARFACSAAGYVELGQQLANSEPQPVSILVDLIEEEFREETLPHALGRDRTRLHQRHAGKLFRSTPFRHFRCVGRQRAGRRDDLVSFSALLNRDNIEPVLTLLERAQVPVKGIYSLPIITGYLLKALPVKSGNILVVTEQPDSGLRETFIRDGKVHFSRLAPISDSSPADYRTILTAEAVKTRRYLNTLRLLPQDQGLDVYALCDAARVGALQQETKGDSSDIHIHAINLADLARQLGFRDYPDNPFSDPLFCYLLARRPVQNHYARPQHLRNWRSFQARQGLRAATWLLAVSAATLSGMNIVDGKQIEAATLKTEQLTEQVSSDYQRALQGLPVEPVTALSMREAIQLADLLSAHTVDLDQLFKLMGRGFSARPDLAMDKMTWFVGDNADAENAAEIRRADTGAAAAEPYLVTKVQGHMRKFNGSYRQAHQQIDAMAKWIAAQPGIVRADIVREPLDTRTDANLQGGLATPGDTEATDFELRIVLDLHHEPV